MRELFCTVLVAEHDLGWVKRRFAENFDVKFKVRQQPKIEGEGRLIKPPILEVWTDDSLSRLDVLKLRHQIRGIASHAKFVKVALHDVVNTTEQIEDIPEGSVGTVVFVYRGGREFEVEFPKDIFEGGDHPYVATLSSDKLAVHRN